METAVCKLTVWFEDPFWVGVVEREAGGRYEACKITFGAEPRDCEVYQFVLERWSRLRFGPSLPASPVEDRAGGPKRARRAARRQTETVGIGTKAQRALQLQREQGKQVRKVLSRGQREAEAERKFQLRQEKRRKKHRGR